MARATVCHPNLNINDIFKELRAMGFNSVVLSLVDAKNTSELRIRSEDFKALTNELDAMSEDFIDAVKNKKKYPYRLFFDVIALVYQKMKVIQPCGAGRAMIAVGTDGILYPCQRFMGMSDYSYGDVHSGISGKVRDEFLNTTVENKEKCTTCWAKYLCGGGCPQKRIRLLKKRPNFSAITQDIYMSWGFICIGDLKNGTKIYLEIILREKSLKKLKMKLYNLCNLLKLDYCNIIFHNNTIKRHNTF